MLKRFTYAILSILLALSNLVTVSADYKALTTEENVNVYTLPALSEEQISDQIKTYLMNKYDSDHFQIISYLPESDLKKQSITRSQSQTYIGETTRTVQVGLQKINIQKVLLLKTLLVQFITRIHRGLMFLLVFQLVVKRGTLALDWDIRRLVLQDMG